MSEVSERVEQITGKPVDTENPEAFLQSLQEGGFCLIETTEEAVPETPESAAPMVQSEVQQEWRSFEDDGYGDV
jgi:hypothetical protein